MDVNFGCNFVSFCEHLLKFDEAKGLGSIGVECKYNIEWAILVDKSRAKVSFWKSFWSFGQNRLDGIHLGLQLIQTGEKLV